MLGKEGEPVAPTPEKIVASPVPGLYDDEEEDTEVTPTPEVKPWGPRPHDPTPTTPTWDPWNPFKLPPGVPPKKEPKAEPKAEPKTEPKVEPKVPPTLGPVKPTLPPPPTTNPPWDPFKLPPPTQPKVEPKKEPPKTEPQPKTEPKKEPTTVWPKKEPVKEPVTPTQPVTPTKPVTPVVPAKPEKKEEPKKEESNRYDLLKIMTRAYAQAVGVYDRGSLTRADLLPNSGDGYLKIFQERQRGFGSLDLITLIIEASREIRRDFPAVERVQIGDLSDKNGGKLGGHGSHQNGLDADLAYFRKDRVEMPPTGSKPGSTGFGAGFVQKGQVLPTFDTEANWRFIQMLDHTGRLDRIFVDQRIKKEFCKLAVAKGMRDDWKETLRKLRHWPNHADHMHVRITCPKNSKGCKPIPAIPAGDGCDALLDRGGIVRTSGGFYLNAEDQRRNEAMGEDALDVPEPAIEEHGC